MKVLLNYPPLDPVLKIRRASYIYDRLQPLGLAYLAAALEKAGHQVRIVDAKAESLSIDKVVLRVKEFNPRIVGISSSTPDFCVSKLLAEKIKSAGDYTVLIGGPHVSAIPEETMQESCFDYGVIGEGEETVVELASALSEGNGRNLADIKGIAFRDGKGFIRTQPRPYIEDLDSIPLPARYLLPGITRYRYSWYRKLPTATIITTRGCPYQCVFCDRAVFGNRLRARSIPNILDEIELLVRKYKVRGLDIVDDLFVASPERISDFCSGLLERGLKVAWSCLSRTDIVSEGILKLMKEAGCWQIAYGIESGSQEVLRRIKKNITLKNIEDAVSWTQAVGIRRVGLFILGLPGDNEENMNHTLRFSNSLNLDRAVFFIAQPYPGSEMFKTALAKGEIAREVPYRYYHKYFFPKKLPYLTEGVNESLLLKYWKKCYRSFYLKPWRMTRQTFGYYELRELLSRLINFVKTIS